MVLIYVSFMTVQFYSLLNLFIFLLLILDPSFVRLSLDFKVLRLFLLNHSFAGLMVLYHSTSQMNIQIYVSFIVKLL